MAPCLISLWNKNQWLLDSLSAFESSLKLLILSIDATPIKGFQKSLSMQKHYSLFFFTVCLFGYDFIDYFYSITSIFIDRYRVIYIYLYFCWYFLFCNSCFLDLIIPTSGSSWGRPIIFSLLEWVICSSSIFSRSELYSRTCEWYVAWFLDPLPFF